MRSLRPFVLYAGRRWRTTGIVLVAVLGTLVYGAVADRGHDPRWSREGADLEIVVLADDGLTVYALRQATPGTHDLAALDPGGAVLWNRTLDAPDVFVGAGRDWVAAASVGEPSRLVVRRSHDGVVLLDTAVGGTPRGLAADGETVAVALESPENTVLVWTRLAYDRSLHLPGFVTALDVADETVAAASGDGTVVVDRAGAEVARFDAGMSVRALRLDGNGTRLVVGGLGPEPGDLSGVVATYDVDVEARRAHARWSSGTVSGVGSVDIAKDGSVVLAVEESPGASALRLTAGDGGPAVRHVADGIVPRHGTGGPAGARLAPDGAGVAVATLSGDVGYVESATGRVLWTWRAKGALAVDFAADAPGTFAASARLVPSRGYDRLVVFDLAEEPFARDMALLVPALVLAELTAGAFVLGVGRAREQRT